MELSKANLQSHEWRSNIKIDRDGRAYLDLSGAALFLEISIKTLSNRIYEGIGPRVLKKNGRLRFYVDDLKAYDKGLETVARETNWYKIKKTA